MWNLVSCGISESKGDLEACDDRVPSLQHDFVGLAARRLEVVVAVVVLDQVVHLREDGRGARSQEHVKLKRCLKTVIFTVLTFPYQWEDRRSVIDYETFCNTGSSRYPRYFYLLFRICGIENSINQRFSTFETHAPPNKKVRIGVP